MKEVPSYTLFFSGVVSEVSVKKCVEIITEICCLGDFKKFG